MQAGNRRELDAAREAIRDAFDAIWIASSVKIDDSKSKEARAVRCAIALDRPTHFHNSPNWIIFPGGRACGATWDIIRA